jgi:hypothetical protein
MIAKCGHNSIVFFSAGSGQDTKTITKKIRDMKSHKELTLKGFADLPDIRLNAALCSLTIEDCSKVKVQPKGMVKMKTLQGERDLC